MHRNLSLREMLAGPRAVVVPGVHNALFAKQVEHEGFECVFVGETSVAAGLGLPDLGVITQTEIASALGYVCRSVSIPVIADAGSGFGSAITLDRAIRDYEALGASAALINDRRFPTDAGPTTEERLVPLEEGVQKVRAALDARRDPDFLIIARTDALRAGSWDEAERRAVAFHAAGADLVLVDGVESQDDLGQYVARLVDRGMPCALNGDLIGEAEATGLKFRMQILPAFALAVVHSVTTAAMRSLFDTGIGSYRAGIERAPAGEGLNEVLGLPEIYEKERRYAVELPE